MNFDKEYYLEVAKQMFGTDRVSIKPYYRYFQSYEVAGETEVFVTAKTGVLYFLEKTDLTDYSVSLEQQIKFYYEGLPIYDETVPRNLAINPLVADAYRITYKGVGGGVFRNDVTGIILGWRAETY